MAAVCDVWGSMWGGPSSTVHPHHPLASRISAIWLGCSVSERTPRMGFVSVGCTRPTALPLQEASLSPCLFSLDQAACTWRVSGWEEWAGLSLVLCLLSSPCFRLISHCSFDGVFSNLHQMAPSRIHHLDPPFQNLPFLISGGLRNQATKLFKSKTFVPENLNEWPVNGAWEPLSE